MRKTRLFVSLLGVFLIALMVGLVQFGAVAAQDDGQPISRAEASVEHVFEQAFRFRERLLRAALHRPQVRVHDPSVVPPVALDRRPKRAAGTQQLEVNQLRNADHCRLAYAYIMAIWLQWREFFVKA